MPPLRGLYPLVGGGPSESADKRRIHAIQVHYTYSTLFRLEPPVDLRFPGPSDRRQLGPARLHDPAERHGALKSALESLINRFIDQLSQVSSGDFCMLVPCVERGFGGANGVGHREAWIGVGGRDDGQGGSHRAGIEPSVEERGAQSLCGDALSVSLGNTLDKTVQT
jgi:hypothetical protein